VLVQSNFGGVLQVAGVPIGQALGLQQLRLSPDATITLKVYMIAHRCAGYPAATHCAIPQG